MYGYNVGVYMQTHVLAKRMHFGAKFHLKISFLLALRNLLRKKYFYRKFLVYF